MLKLVSPRRTRAHRREIPPDMAPMLRGQADDDLVSAQATQRTVGVGRRTIVEAYGSLQRALSQHDMPERIKSLSDTERQQVVTGFAGQLKTIHERLLLLSSSVELEIDRLDVLRTEIEQIMRSVPPDGGAQ